LSRHTRLARLDDRLRYLAKAEVLVGLDEVGRGCLAGPVVVGAVALPAGTWLEGVRDSKTLSLAQRERAYLRIQDAALGWAALCVGPGEVDELNVLHASLVGMQRVLRRLETRLGRPADLALVDGHMLPPELDQPARALVKGDGRSQSIAAASIVAKVLRDRLMRSWHRHYPDYGFAKHVGYPTREHLDALERVGPCPLHRRTFAPVARAIAQTRLAF
jgi:ribonuclease HII